MSPEAGTEMAPTPAQHDDRIKAIVWAAVVLYVLASAYSVFAIYRRLDALEQTQAEAQKRSDDAIAVLGSKLKEISDSTQRQLATKAAQLQRSQRAGERRMTTE